MMWNPCGMNRDVESMWKVMDSIVEWYGFHSGMMWNPCRMSWNHGRCVWNPWDNVWNPCGDLWNRTIPPGIHLECGGRVNYCNNGLQLAVPSNCTTSHHSHITSSRS